MEALYRFFSGLLAGMLSLFAPIAPTILCALIFIAADFVSGVAASRAEARRDGRRWFFESREAWRTVTKTGFTVTAIAMIWLTECCILNFMTLNLTRLFAGFVCGVELWSFLENASVLSSAPLFEWLKRYVRRRIEHHIG
ncbi:MAG: phage holin family protein [Alistipes sp.]|nr:phage holin family protein [Alistipes sp.]